MKKWLALDPDLVNGSELYGPFDTEDEAEQFIDGYLEFARQGPIEVEWPTEPMNTPRAFFEGDISSGFSIVEIGERVFVPHLPVIPPSERISLR